MGAMSPYRMARLDDPGVTTLTIACSARTQFVEQLGRDRVLSRSVASGLAPGVQAAPLAERDEAIDNAPQILGLG